MHACGNDVVDLGDPAIAHHHTQSRFVARVCAPEEARRVHGDKRALWEHFAAKEAAYKVLVKLGHAVGFAHRQLVVADDFRAIAFRDVELQLHVEGDDTHVHAVAWIGPRPRWATRRTDLEPSRAARVLLEEVLRSMHVRDTRVVRDPVAGSWDGYGPPRLASGGADVSLSHDGVFVACAASAIPRIAASTRASAPIFASTSRPTAICARNR